MAQLYGNDLIEAGRSKYGQGVLPPLQVHGKQQAHQAQVVVAMQMADEDMGDFMKAGMVAHELQLRTFPAINQIVFVIQA